MIVINWPCIPGEYLDNEYWSCRSPNLAYKQCILDEWIIPLNFQNKIYCKLQDSLMCIDLQINGNYCAEPKYGVCIDLSKNKNYC